MLASSHSCLHMYTGGALEFAYAVSVAGGRVLIKRGAKLS